MFEVKEIFKKKWKLKVNKKIDLLLLDDNYVDFQFKSLKYHLLFNEFYFLEAFKSLLTYFFKKKENKITLYETYLKTLINEFDPKVAVGHDKNGKIFLFKKLFPNKISIAYQFGYIFDLLISEQYKKQLQNKKVDYYLVYDKRSKNILKKIVKSNYMIAGSIKANETCNWVKKNKIYDIMFISNYRPINKNDQHWKIVKYQNDHDSFLIKTISNYCKKNKLKFCIALSSSRKDKTRYNFHKNEINFLKQLSDNFILHRIDSYNLAKITNLCIGTFSNLAYELLLSKKKTNVFYTNKKNGLQYSKKINPKFVLYTKSKKIIENRIENLLKMSDKVWERSNKSFYFSNVYDYKNNLLKRLIKKEVKNFL